MTQEPEKILKGYLDHKAVPHGLLFVGSNMPQMTSDAMHFVYEVMKQKGVSSAGLEKLKSGTHPDFSVHEPFSKSAVYTIEQVRELCMQSQLFPHESPVQFFVLKYAERMQPAAGNALLKTLEEPSKPSYFILLAERGEEILPTLQSRLQKVYFDQSTEDGKESTHLTLLKELLKNWPNFNYNQLHLACASIHEELEKQFPSKEKDLNQTLSHQKESSHLFLEIEKWFSKLNEKAPISHRKFNRAFETSQIGYQRSIKLSTCLESLLLHFI